MKKFLLWRHEELSKDETIPVGEPDRVQREIAMCR